MIHENRGNTFVYTFTYADYEQAKREWSDRNPRATPEEYQAAMIRIAAKMGL